MTLFKLIIPLLLLGNVQAITLDNVFQNEQLELEQYFQEEAINVGNVSSDNVNASPLTKKILKDVDNRVQKKFHITPYFYNAVEFWFRIYTQYSSKNVVIHDKRNLDLIFSVMNFEELHRSKKLNRYQKANRQDSLIRKETKRIKKALRILGKTRKPKNKMARRIQRILIHKRVKVPRSGKRRIRYFNGIIKNLRVQTGQRDKIFQGILNVSAYHSFIQEMMSYFELPSELLAISFVESSFNPRARSKVGASGVWQFMPHIAKAIMPMDRHTDSRNNPLLASIGAFHLLKQNYQILKRWDLAVTAYNSGTKHIIRAQRKYKRKNISLEYIFRRYKHPHLGFASKNFYTSYIALVYALAYKDVLYPIKGLNYSSITNAPKFRYDNIKVYVSKCGLIPNRLFSALQRSSLHLRRINTHLKRPKRMYPRGTVILSDIPLTSKRYLRLSKKQMRRNFPKNWKRLLKGHRCIMK